jgi:hypothetical protein
MRRQALLVVALSASLGACRSVRPLDPSTRLDGRPVAELVLRFAESCVTLPGGTPRGRPDGVRSHVLPAGLYRPALEDDRGVYFASEHGISVTEPAPRGTRSRPGGVYLSRDPTVAWEYLGDAGGISTRQPLPQHCRFELEPAAQKKD